MKQLTKKLDPLVSIRGIVAWWVVLFHSVAFMDGLISPRLQKAISHGYLAVDLFFVLSGFVIFLSYHASVLNGLSSIGDFYWKRFSRIYPVHILVLTAYLLLAVCFIYFSNSGRIPGSYTVSGFVSSLFLVQAWTDEALTWNVPAWSISAEWSVYILFPLIALAFRKYIRRLHAHFLAIALALCSLALVYAVADVSSLNKSLPQMAVPRAFFEFILGCVAGSLFLLHRPILIKCRTVLAFTFLCALLVYIGYGINDYLIAPGASFLLICYLAVDDSYVGKVLSNRVLVYLGEISYSTYIVHYLIYDALKAGWVVEIGRVRPLLLVLSFFVVLLISVLLHHLVEVPVQRYLRDRIDRRTPSGLRSAERN